MAYPSDLGRPSSDGPFAIADRALHDTSSPGPPKAHHPQPRQQPQPGNDEARRRYEERYAPKPAAPAGYQAPQGQGGYQQQQHQPPPQQYQQHQQPPPQQHYQQQQQQQQQQQYQQPPPQQQYHAPPPQHHQPPPQQQYQPPQQQYQSPQQQHRPPPQQHVGPASSSYGQSQQYQPQHRQSAPSPHPPRPAQVQAPPPPPQNSQDAELRALFASCDRDRSGHLTADELQTLLTQDQRWQMRPREDCVKMLMNIFDTDRSGSINFVEFEGLYRYIKDWHGIFQRFDRDRSGLIDRRELHQALLGFGFSLPPELVRKLEKRFAPPPGVDGHAAQGMAFDRFLMACVTVKHFTEAFRKMDVRNEGRLTLEYSVFMDLVLDAPS